MLLFHLNRITSWTEASRFGRIVGTGAAMSIWAIDEFAMADLCDGRLNKRLINLADRFADKPIASLPGTCPDWSETQMVYRANKPKRPLGWQDILQPHIDRTEVRMRQHPVVLCWQNTTELNINGQCMDGLGPQSYEAQRRVYLHPTYAVSPQRKPLGVTDTWIRARQSKDADGKRPEARESLRWTEGYVRVAEMVEAISHTRLVYVADREAGIVEFMRRAWNFEHPADWLIRSHHNRCLPSGAKLWADVLADEVVGEIEFTLPARHSQVTRTVRQQVGVRTVNLPDGKGGHVSAICGIAREVCAPAGVKPVEWRLLTNLAVAGFEAVVELIDWYHCDWEIDTFFSVPKNLSRMEVSRNWETSLSWRCLCMPGTLGAWYGCYGWAECILILTPRRCLRTRSGRARTSWRRFRYRSPFPRYARSSGRLQCFVDSAATKATASRAYKLRSSTSSAYEISSSGPGI